MKEVDYRVREDLEEEWVRRSYLLAVLFSFVASVIAFLFQPFFFIAWASVLFAYPFGMLFGDYSFYRKEGLSRTEALKSLFCF
jgi:hypothetical protein